MSQGKFGIENTGIVFKLDAAKNQTIQKRSETGFSQGGISIK